MQARPGAFTLTGMSVGGCVKPYEWQPKCNAPADIAWPAKGQRVSFHFVSPADSQLTVDVHYEIYDGLPVMMKTFTVHNRTAKELVVTKFEGEHLAVQPTISRMLHVESDYSFGAANFNEQGSALGIHISGGDPKFKGSGSARARRGSLAIPTGAPWRR